MTFWEIFFSAFGGAGVLVLLLGFFGKGLTKLLLDKDLENHKSRLRSEGEAQLERLRSNLAIAANERHIVFSKLHEERAKIIAELYELLAIAVEKTKSLLSPATLVGEPEKPEKAKAAFSAIYALHDYYIKKKIWFTPDTCNQVHSLIENLHKLGTKFFVYWNASQKNPKHAGVNEKMHKVWFDAWDAIDKDDVPPAMEALEDELRHLIGVANEESDDEE